MRYKLPFDYADLLTIRAREALTPILTPLDTATPGDIVAVVVDHQLGRVGDLIEKPIRAVLQRTDDGPKRAGHFQTSYFAHFDPEDQARLALPLKRFEASHGLRTFHLQSIAHQFVDGMLDDTIRLVLTNDVSVLYHSYANHWISTRRVYDPLQQEDIEKLLRIIIPSDLSAHGKIELLANMGEVIELVQSLGIFPSDRAVELDPPDLKSSVAVA